mgnify:CR=1 FL=1
MLAGVQRSTEAYPQAYLGFAKYAACARPGECTNAYDHIELQQLNGALERVVAGLEQGLALHGWQLVGRAVFSALFHKRG